jgi:hypothetical protein
MDELQCSDRTLETRLRGARNKALLPAYARSVLEQKLFGGCDSRVDIGRYTLVRPLGEGAMGRVYEAHDRRRDQRVALKIFRNTGPTTAQLLKREFRALSGITHPNLVAFYDLYVRRDACFFTMELVEGVEFVKYVRHSTREQRHGHIDAGPLRGAIHQLASATRALHAAGKVHRDLKPSNVLIAGSSGRVVVLDFGLITTFSEGSSDGTFPGQLVGTPAYMAPEQFELRPVTPASDCYAIGGILYHALTGSPPFSDAAPDELARLRATTVPWLPTIPGAEDLCRLCLELLQPDPGARADCTTILNRLDGHLACESGLTPDQPAEEPALIGRKAELQVLQEAAQAAEAGCVAVVVAGVAGVGKSALVRSFLDGLDPRDYIVLRAQCHEQESVPYKTLDGVVDALIRFMMRCSPLELASLTPRYAAELMRVFPALGRTQGFAQAAQRAQPVLDQQENKRRAISALREVLARLSQRARLIICAEDLHWGDHDSVGFIQQLLTSPDAPSCLCIGTVRIREGGEELDRRVEQFFGRDRIIGSKLDVRLVRLGPLADGDATELAQLLLKNKDLRQAQRLARESGGSPLLLGQLVQFAGESASAARVDAHGAAREQHQTSSGSLEEMVRMRIATLSPGARELLRLTALAGGSIEQELASAAARLADGTVVGAIRELRAAQLIHRHGMPGHARLEVYHSRLAQAVLEGLEPGELRGLHAKLAMALAERGPRDDPRLSRHLRHAGRAADAVALVIDSGDRAIKALAFSRAGYLYSVALHWGVPEELCEEVKLKRAEALCSAGRGSANAFLELAEVAKDPLRRMSLYHRAGQEFLLSGQLRQGRTVLAKVIELPRSRTRTLLGVASQRLRLAVRGRGFRPQQAEQIPDAELARLDLEGSLAQTLLMVDTPLGQYLQRRVLLHALRVGEPTRVLRSLALEAVCTAANGGSLERGRVREILRLVDELGNRIEQPGARANAAAMRAVSSFFLGDAEQALSEADAAESMLREKCSAVAHEISVLQLVSLRSLMMLGRWNDFCRCAQEAIREALQRGSPSFSATLRTHTHFACLVVDDVAGSAREIAAARRDWPHDELHMQNLAILAGEARMHMYQGDGVSAWRHLSEMWPRLRRSLLLNTLYMRVEMYSLRGCAAALSYGQTSETQYRRAAYEDAHQLLKMQMRGATGTALLIMASLKTTERKIQSAHRLLDTAALSFERDRLPFYSAIARYQADRIGPTPRSAGDAARVIAQAGVRNCAAFAQMYTGHSGN